MTYYHDISSPNYIVTYEQAVKLAELGMTEGCLFHYFDGKLKPNVYGDGVVGGIEPTEDVPVTTEQLIESYNAKRKDSKFLEPFYDAPFVFQAIYFLNFTYGIYIELVQNPIKRYSFSFNLVNNMHRNADGSFGVIYTHHKENSTEKKCYTTYLEATSEALTKALEILSVDNKIVSKTYEVINPPKYEAMQYNGLAIKNVIDFVGSDNVRVRDENEDNEGLFDLMVLEPQEGSLLTVKPNDYIVKKDGQLFGVYAPEDFVKTFK